MKFPIKEVKKEKAGAGDYRRAFLLLTLAVVVAGLYFSGSLDPGLLLRWGGRFTESWWAAAGIICLQALLFMLALPGSSFFWIVAPLYPPLTATLILVAGSTLGGLAACLFARSLADSWLKGIKQKRFFRLLEKRSDFLSQCALRIIPAFPHSFINYSAGILKVPLIPFIAAAVIGLSIKTFLYCTTIHQTMAMNDPSELLRVKTMAPLITLALLFFAAHIYRKHLLHSGRGD